jgi:FlaA1/EpsC-like NDP-sugar epimerase
MSIHSIATGRKTSLFAADLSAQAQSIAAMVGGRRILAVGAAGSIGSNTVAVLSRFKPQALHVIDQNENGLAEFIRQFRSSAEAPSIPDLRMLPLDYGSAAMRFFLEESEPYDIVLNFAAIKHVRSEKDAFSIMQMLDTNIVKQARFLRWLGRYSPKARYFSVSTDKAANPSSFMGATKRIMEHVMFSADVAPDFEGPVTSARFANVAFSNGSLLQSFENRLARREPLACPREIRRYFVSLAESGEICTLAALLAPKNHIAIPNLDPETSLVLLQGIAEGFLAEHGYKPELFDSEASAIKALPSLIGEKRWALLLTPPDTSGEKPYEEFVAAGESVVGFGLEALSAVKHRPAESGDLNALLAELDRLCGIDGAARSGEIAKDMLKHLIGKVEPEFLRTHIDSQHNLDQRA